MKRLKLSNEEETELALAAQQGDMRAKERLFAAHVPLISWIARRYSGPDWDELFQAACEGWLNGVRTFKPKKGASFKSWMTFWVRAYAGRITLQHLEHSHKYLPLETDDEEGEPVAVDVGDDGRGAEEVHDALWRRQAHGIIDGMKDRKLAVVLQGRARGLTLEKIAVENSKLLRVRGGSGREWVRQLEQRAFLKASQLVRAG